MFYTEVLMLTVKYISPTKHGMQTYMGLVCVTGFIGNRNEIGDYFFCAKKGLLLYWCNQ